MSHWTSVLSSSLPLFFFLCPYRSVCPGWAAYWRGGHHRASEKIPRRQNWSWVTVETVNVTQDETPRPGGRTCGHSHNQLDDSLTLGKNDLGSSLNMFLFCFVFLPTVSFVSVAHVSKSDELFQPVKTGFPNVRERRQSDSVHGPTSNDGDVHSFVHEPGILYQVHSIRALESGRSKVSDGLTCESDRSANVWVVCGSDWRYTITPTHTRRQTRHLFTSTQLKWSYRSVWVQKSEKRGRSQEFSERILNGRTDDSDCVWSYRRIKASTDQLPSADPPTLKSWCSCLHQSLNWLNY